MANIQIPEYLRPDGRGLPPNAEILYKEHQVLSRLGEMAAALADEYSEHMSVHQVICTPGGRQFADEIRTMVWKHTVDNGMHMVIPTVDYYNIWSYAGCEKSGGVYMDKPSALKGPIEDNNVEIFIPAISSGRSLDVLVRIIKDYKPASISVISLLTKHYDGRDNPTEESLGVNKYMSAFNVGKNYVFGHGLGVGPLGLFSAVPYVCADPTIPL